MAIIYGDFTGTFEGSLKAYPLSFSGSGLFNTTLLAEEMMQLLPSYYFLGNNVRRIMEIIAASLLSYNEKIEDLRDQLYVATATWGLKFWEELVGIPVSEDLPYESRRVLILNKLRNCSSEKCFIEGLEAIVAGSVLISLLDPKTNPYQMSIELRTSDITYNGPVTSPKPKEYGSGTLDGEYVYKVTYGFPAINVPTYIKTSPSISGVGETSSGVTPIRTNEKQKISSVGSITGGSFTITYDSMWDPAQLPRQYTTDVISYDASYEEIYAALSNLPNLSSGDIRVYGGPLPFNDIIIEFIGAESGFRQQLIVVDNSGLEGGGYLVESRVQTGSTDYVDSESDSIYVNNKTILLENLPISNDGAISRNIYRKRLDVTQPTFNTVKVGDPSNEYRYVGTVSDNITTVFLDEVSDISLSDVQKVDFGSYTALTPTYKLQFDSIFTAPLSSTSSKAAVKSALEALSTSLGYSLGVTVDGSFVEGFKITFNGGDVVGCSVPLLKVSSTDLPAASVTKIGPTLLTERNNAFTYKLQRAIDYIYNTKPAHIHVQELRVGGFRASISRAGESV